MLVHRLYFDDLVASLKRHKIVALVGARQTGKTTLLRQLEEHLRKKDTTRFDQFYLSLDFDSLEFRKELGEDENLLERMIVQKAGRPIDQMKEPFYLFLDEVQKHPPVLEILKRIYDRQPQVKIFITGSSALQIMDQGAETLAGRIEYHTIFPFTFLEATILKESLARTHPPSDTAGHDALQLIRNLMKKLLHGELGHKDLEGVQARRVWFKSVLREDEREFLVSGLYPEVLACPSQEEKFRLLDNYLTAYVERDIRALANVSDWSGYHSLLEIAASRTGQLVDYTKMGSNAGIDVRTVKKYLSLLEQTFVAFSLPSFSINVEKRVSKSPKIFFYDNGILSRLLKITDLRHYESLGWMGKIFENAVMAELMKYLRNLPLPVGIYFWRTYAGAEVDCILDAEGCLVPIEIKSATVLEERDWNGLKSFQKEFPKRVSRGYILYRGNNVIRHPDERFIAIPYHVLFR